MRLATTASARGRIGCSFGALAVLAFAATRAVAQELYVDPQFDVGATPDIQYGSAPIGSPPGDFALRLDLYEPVGEGVPSPRPVVITIHGGSFVGGSRKDPNHVRIATEMASRGYTAISISYRLIPQQPVTAPEFQPIGLAQTAVQDLATAHAWLLDNAGDLDADPSRIIVFGSSAGAITIVHAAYQLDDIGLAPLSGISSIVDLWGGFIGPPASALMQAGEPPVFIVHGDEDTTVPARLSYELAEAAEAVGIAHELHIVEGAGHSFGPTRYFTREVSPGVTLFDETVEFVATVPEPGAGTSLGAVLVALWGLRRARGSRRLSSRAAGRGRGRARGGRPAARDRRVLAGGAGAFRGRARR